MWIGLAFTVGRNMHFATSHRGLSGAQVDTAAVHFVEYPPREPHALVDCPMVTMPVFDGALADQPTAPPELCDFERYLPSLLTKFVSRLSSDSAIALKLYLSNVETVSLASFCSGTDCPRLVLKATWYLPWTNSLP
jgi:hypothetical protein